MSNAPMPTDPEPIASSGESHGSPIAVYAAIAGNLGIAIAKFVAAVITGSSAMISESIHSTVDTGNQILLLVGIRRSDRPAEDLHPFGHGKELYFWSLIVAMVLFGAGGGVAIYEGVTHILDPTPIEDPLANYVVLAIALVLEGSSLTIASREMARDMTDESLWHAIRNTKDPSVVTVLFEDSAAIIGIVAAFTGIWLAERTGDPRFDGLGSIVIGIVLGTVAILLAYESRGLLIGERADHELIDRLRTEAERDEAVSEVVRIRTMHLGPAHVLVTMRIAFHDMSSEAITRAIDGLIERLAELDGRVDDVTIQPVGRSR